MLVRFLTNLGRFDAIAYGLNWQQCREGMTLDAPPPAATKLIERKIAVAEKPIEAVAKKSQVNAPAKA